MSTFAIGDIHGNSAALNDLLDQLSSETGDGDTVVFLGDYIDRGPDTRGCLDRILSFRSGSSARVVTLMGNHEEWLLRTVRDHTRHSWLLGMEALPTIASYSPQAAVALRHAAEAAGPALVMERVDLPYGVFLELLPVEHLAFLEALEPYYGDEDAVCSHGGVDPRIPAIGDQPLEALLWGAGGFPDAYEGSRRVVYGHRNNADITDEGWPLPGHPEPPPPGVSRVCLRQFAESAPSRDGRRRTSFVPRRLVRGAALSPSRDASADSPEPCPPPREALRPDLDDA